MGKAIGTTEPVKRAEPSTTATDGQRDPRDRAEDEFESADIAPEDEFEDDEDDEDDEDEFGDEFEDDEDDDPNEMDDEDDYGDGDDFE